MSKEPESKELMLTPSFIIELQKERDNPEIGEKLEEWGVIERKGRYKKRFVKLTDKGVKKALNISLVMEDKKGGDE
jgi:hypothetical protein